MHPNVAGALINSALYIVMVFVAGIVTGHALAWQYAIGCSAFAFFSHALALIGQRLLAQIAVYVSWGVGGLAFAALLF